MYEAHFGFSRRPFASVPRVDQYYPATAIEGARQTLARCIQRAEGVGIVIGAAGTGKTLLCLLLAEQSHNELKAVHLSCGRLSTRRALLQAILFGLEQPYRGMDEGELRLALVDYLMLGDQCAEGLLLLVDEAHTLPLRLLEEIRMITNLVARGQPRVRLVLAGGPALEERLASPRMEAFSQRIVARCYLESLNGEETEGYIRAQLAGAGVTAGELMTADACQAVYQATDGVPRLINQVCDHALVLAFTRGLRQVTRGEIEEAWGDLQQLPAPWSGAGDAGAEGGIIEFGGLADEPAPTVPIAAHAQPPSPTLRVTPAPDDPLSGPAEQVEKIQEALASLDDDFRPAGSIRPEMELVFDDATNPLSEQFEEEEVILDRYAAVCRGSPLQQPAAAWKPDALHEPPLAPLPGAADEPPETVPLHEERSVKAGEEPMITVEEGYEGFEEPLTRRPPVVRRQEYRQLFARLRRSC